MQVRGLKENEESFLRAGIKTMTSKGPSLFVSLLTLGFIAASSVLAQNNRTLSYTTVSWSPDGMSISFTQRSNEGTDIYTMRSDGSMVTKFNIGRKPMYSSWSPDGKKFVFSSITAGDAYDIFVMNADSTNIIPLTKDVKQNWAAVFSPDGKQIAFNSTRDIGGMPQIYVMNSDGSSPKRLTQDLTSSYFIPTWSPDGKQIAYYTYVGGKSQIMVMNADGSNPYPVTDGTEPFWSSDGKTILFGTKLNTKDSSFYEATLKGGDIRPVCNVSGYLGRLSRDGKSLLYIGDNSAGNSSSKNAIYILNIDNCRTTLLRD